MYFHETYAVKAVMQKERRKVELRTAVSPKDVKYYTTQRLREEFLIQNLFVPGEIKLVYSHIDRIITGAAVPVEPIVLTAGDELRAEYFCQRRELGVINIGGAGTITVDGRSYRVGFKEAMYIGMGSKDITFASDDPEHPAKYYLNSAPAHRTCPTVLIKPEGTPEDGVVIVKDENKVELGSLEDANQSLPREAYGTRCLATPMTDVWRFISILRCRRMLLSCIIWVSPMRRAIS